MNIVRDNYRYRLIDTSKTSAMGLFQILEKDDSLGSGWRIRGTYYSERKAHLDFIKLLTS